MQISRYLIKPSQHLVRKTFVIPFQLLAGAHMDMVVTFGLNFSKIRQYFPQFVQLGTTRIVFDKARYEPITLFNLILFKISIYINDSSHFDFVCLHFILVICFGRYYVGK
jgi:hypothetical protein